MPEKELQEKAVQDKILIVEDDPLLLPSFERTLTDAGYDVSTANCGKDAMKLIKKNYYNLVLTDIVMEDINGIQLMEKIKKISPSTLIILITGYSSVDTAVSAVKNNASDYLLKPCKKKELKKRIKLALDSQKEAEAEQKNRLNEVTNTVLNTYAEKLDSPLSNIECYADLMSDNSLQFHGENQSIITVHVGKQLKDITKKMNEVVGNMKKPETGKKNSSG